MKFSGFPERSEVTSIPAAFFTEVLPAANDLAELKVILSVLRGVKRKKGSPRFLTRGELRATPELWSGLGANDSQREEALTRGLNRAVERGVLLAVSLGGEGGPQTAYFINDPEGRRAVDLARAGAIDLGRPVAPEPQRETKESNIFALYEETIGLLTPTIAEELKEAETAYPPAWVRDAFRVAAESNKRSWRYVHAILDRWTAEGRDDGTDRGHPAAKARRFGGRYGPVVHWR
ncbi:MAG: DnaD domain protein [Chloroflexi bacterium]|nr:DnaD domain protein [Chloroflexota bacterium]